MSLPQYSIGTATRFQTLDWMPLQMILKGDDFPASVGPNSFYPAEQTDAQAAWVYWKPQQYAIVTAGITSEEYGVVEMSVPIIPNTYRFNGAIIADDCFKLIAGIGGEVTQTQEFPELGDDGLVVECVFRLHPIVAMERAFEHEKFWFRLDASITATPNSTGAIASAATFVGEPAIATGQLRCMVTPAARGDDLGLVAPLYSPPPVAFSVAEVTDALIEIDFVPWPFAD